MCTACVLLHGSAVCRGLYVANQCDGLKFRTMADLVGKDGIHHVAGACELCGETCDAGAEELNALTCTFVQCNASVYHQDCLEKYLKRSGCEKCALHSRFT